MRIQHNITALNAHNKLGGNQNATAKNLEKLSSGFRINRAGDDAAGLAISEKMRGQIRGLDMAAKNAQDGISLIQTAEGGLNETHAILQRMRELAVQSSNGTYKNEVDRENIDKEVEALKSEIDRISTSTHYNGINLLDGSLGGSGISGEYGAKYGVVATAGDLKGAKVTSNIVGAQLKTNVAKAVKPGGETAEWDVAGKVLTLNLVVGQSYSQSQIDELIKNADTSKVATNAPAEISVKLANGQLNCTAAADSTATVAGVRATSTDGAMAGVAGDTAGVNGTGYADTITLTANNYGAFHNMVFTFKLSAAPGKESVEITAARDDQGSGEATINLATGVEYTEEDIQKILREAGLDYEVKLTDANSPDGDNTVKFSDSTKTFTATVEGGAGVGKDGSTGGGEGLVFQIGANGVKDQRVSLNVADMSSSGIGVNRISLATRETSNAAIDTIDKAINIVSSTRADLGALQNRLEHTVNNLTTTSENLTAAESRIRDVDMAKEMMTFTKNNILSQAAQSMLAQANQQPQGVLQLLQ